MWFERSARRRRRFHGAVAKHRPLPSYRLRPGRAALAVAACLAPITAGFALPATVLAGYTVDHYGAVLDAAYFGYLVHSLALSSAAALAAVVIATFLAYALRLDNRPLLRAATRVAGIGYAVPGAVLAVGLIVPLAGLDNRVDQLFRAVFGFSTGLILSGTVFALIFGYVVRFLALAFGAVESGLGRVPHNLDDAARSLGCRPGGLLRRVHAPLLRGSVLTAVILVFVDTMKELPMTVLLRPFNYETLATFVHQYASDELLDQAAPAALTIAVAGILPVILLSRVIAASRPSANGAR